MTYAIIFNHDTLQILILIRNTPEARSKIERGREHTVSEDSRLDNHTLCWNFQLTVTLCGTQGARR